LSPPTGTVTEVGVTVSVAAIAGAAMKPINRNTPSVARLQRFARTLNVPLAHCVKQGPRHNGTAPGREQENRLSCPSAAVERY
jgi:hypothetical protein